MDVLKRTDLQQLVSTNGKWHVSIYLPTHRAGPDGQQDPIRLKNLLAQAEKSLLGYGIRRVEAQQLLQPAEELLTNSEFWQHRRDGLAIFLSGETSKIYRVPERFDEGVVVGNSFYVHPLLPLFNANGTFYILALSLNRVRLFQATRDTIQEIELPEMPKNMDEALMIEDQEKHLGFQTMTDNSTGGMGAGERPAIHYGQGEENDKKEKILRYFQEVDNGLSSVLQDEGIPMVVAAVDYLIAIYQQVSSYRNLLSDGVTGSPGRQDLNELRSSAWTLVEPIFRRNLQGAIDRFKELRGQQNGLASSDLDEVVKASIGGRVETLLVPLGRQKWGYYDPATDSVHFDPGPTPDNEDMINYAAVQTLLSSGNVYALPADQFPADGDIAAILRYVI